MLFPILYPKWAVNSICYVIPNISKLPIKLSNLHKHCYLFFSGQTTPIPAWRFPHLWSFSHKKNMATHSLFHTQRRRQHAIQCCFPLVYFAPSIFTAMIPLHQVTFIFNLPLMEITTSLKVFPCYYFICLLYICVKSFYINMNFQTLQQLIKGNACF